jgi:hypothetical protein
LQAWKIVLIGTVAVAVTIGSAVHYGFNPLARASGDALATQGMGSGRPSAAAYDPIKPSEASGESKASAGEVGWGPFRTTDW